MYAMLSASMGLACTTSTPGKTRTSAVLATGNPAANRTYAAFSPKLTIRIQSARVAIGMRAEMLVAVTV